MNTLDANKLAQQIQAQLTALTGKKVTLDFYTAFKCEFDRCTKNGEVYTIMGCLEQHLTEIVFCGEHDKLFCQAMKSLDGMSCICGRKCVLSESAMTYGIASHMRAGLLRDQNTRIAGKQSTIHSSGTITAGGGGGPWTNTVVGNTGKIAAMSQTEKDKWLKHHRRNI